MTRAWPIVVAILSACAPEADVPVEGNEPPAPPVEVRASVDKAVATTGDIITYRIEVEREPDIRVTMPEPGAEIAGFRVVDLGRETAEQKARRVVEARWYELRADLVGSYVLPTVDIAWHRGDGDEMETGTATTSEIFVEVESVLPADGEVTDIRDIKPLRRIEEPVPWSMIAVGGVALIAVVAGLLFFLWGRRRSAPTAISVPAHEVAFAALDALRATDFKNPAAVHAWHFAISEVLRTYVEARFGINATDMTREEILPALRELPDLPAAARERFVGFLEQTDRVKFAAYPPRPEEITAAYESALTFVEQTRPAPTPSEEAA